MKMFRSVLIACIALYASSRVLAGTSVEFEGAIYQEAFSDSSETEVLREFLREGDTLENWEKMISERTFPKQKNPKKYVRRLSRMIQSNPLNQCRVYEKDGVYIVDFLVFGEGLGHAEWNLMKVRKRSDGLVVLQYAYALEGNGWGEHLRDERNRILDLWGDFELPE